MLLTTTIKYLLSLKSHEANKLTSAGWSSDLTTPLQELENDFLAQFFKNATRFSGKSIMLKQTQYFKCQTEISSYLIINK